MQSNNSQDAVQPVVAPAAAIHVPPPAPAAPPPASRPHLLLDCHFFYKAGFDDDDASCTAMFVVIALIALGVILGLIVMPIYAARATEDIYRDTCLVTSCQGYVANVRTAGFGLTGAVTLNDNSCRHFLHKSRPCFVKHIVYANKYEVFFTRPGLITAVATGAVGWSVLLGLVLWSVLACVRGTSSVGLYQYLTSCSCCTIMWITFGVLVAYGGLVGVIAFPVVSSDAGSDFVKELCEVNECHDVNYGVVFAETARFNATVYLNNCKSHLGDVLKCYRQRTSGAVLMAKHREPTIIGLGTSSFLLLALIAIVSCIACAFL